jgi:co-chaperonin GroES (HSP10)
MEQITIPKNFPIARKKSVIVKQIIQGTLTTESGLVLPDTIGNNAEKPNVGLIYAVGDEVPNDLKPGLKVYYNQYCNLEILVDGRPYLMFDEREVFCILQEGNHVKLPVKTAKEVRLTTKHDSQSKRVALAAKNSSNAQDKVVEINKKLRKK